MEKLKKYIAYVNKRASTEAIKQIRIGCISVASMMAVSAYITLRAGSNLNWIVQLVILLMAVLTYLTYLPIFPLASCVLCLVMQSFMPIHLDFIASYATLIASIVCFTHTDELYRTFKREEKAKTQNYIKDNGTLSNLIMPEEKVSFTVKSKCPHCGESGFYVSSQPASRAFFKRIISEPVSWCGYCPQCQNHTAMKSAEVKKLALDSGKYPEYKRAQLTNGYLYTFAAFICLFIASAIMFAVILVNQSVVYSADVDGPKLSKGKQFVGEEVLMSDCFVTITQEDWSGDWKDTESILELHMLAYFENENGMFFIPVIVDPDDDIFMPCIKYLTGDAHEAVPRNIHGYIDTIPIDYKKLLDEKAQAYEDYVPGIVTVENEIIYWDNETDPEPDTEYLRFFQIATSVTGLTAAIFLVLDIYINSGAYSEKKQNRYERKKSI